METRNTGQLHQHHNHNIGFHFTSTTLARPSVGLLTVTNRGRNIESHLTSTPSNAGCAEMGDNDQSQQSSTCACVCAAVLPSIADPANL